MRHNYHCCTYIYERGKLPLHPPPHLYNIILLTVLLYSLADIYSTYDNTDIIDASKPSPHPVTITCYAEHVCLHHQVSIVWLMSIGDDSEKKYSTSDSELLQSKFGISLESTCPAYDCMSTLVLPCLENINGTQISCAAYTAACPDVVTSRSSVVTLLTKASQHLPPPPPPPPTLSTHSYLQWLIILLGIIFVFLLLLAIIRLITWMLEDRKRIRRKLHQFFARYLLKMWLSVKNVAAYLTVMAATIWRTGHTLLVSSYQAVVGFLYGVWWRLKWMAATSLKKASTVFQLLRFGRSNYEEEIDASEFIVIANGIR